MNLVTRSILILALLIVAAGTIGGVMAIDTAIPHSHSFVVAKPPIAPVPDPCDGIPDCPW